MELKNFVKEPFFGDVKILWPLIQKLVEPQRLLLYFLEM